MLSPAYQLLFSEKYKARYDLAWWAVERRRNLQRKKVADVARGMLSNQRSKVMRAVGELTLRGARLQAAGLLELEDKLKSLLSTGSASYELNFKAVFEGIAESSNSATAVMLNLNPKPLHPLIKTWLGNYTPKFVDKLNATTLAGVMGKIEQGMVEGWDLAKIGQEVRAQYDGWIKSRPQTIANTEVQIISNVTQQMEISEGNYGDPAKITQVWLTARDAWVRDTHQELEGKKAKFGQPFKPGLKFPGDPDGPAAEVINCRCTLLLEKSQEAPVQKPKPPKTVPPEPQKAKPVEPAVPAQPAPAVPEPPALVTPLTAPTPIEPPPLVVGDLPVVTWGKGENFYEGGLVKKGDTIKLATPADIQTIEWTKVPDKTFTSEPEFPKGKKISTGVALIESDGRVWIYEPKGHYGGYEHTWSKGGWHPTGKLSAQQNALKELYQETGLIGDIVGYVGDYEGTTGVTRIYLGRRTGGAPWAFKTDETATVKLVKPEEALKLLNVERDKKILNDVVVKLGGQPLYKPAAVPPPATVTPTPQPPPAKPEQYYKWSVSPDPAFKQNYEWDPAENLWKKPVEKKDAFNLWSGPKQNVPPGYSWDPDLKYYVKPKTLTYGIKPPQYVLNELKKFGPHGPTARQFYQWVVDPGASKNFVWDDQLQLWKKPVAKGDAFDFYVGNYASVPAGYTWDADLNAYVKPKLTYGTKPPQYVLNELKNNGPVKPGTMGTPGLPAPAPTPPPPPPAPAHPPAAVVPAQAPATPLPGQYYKWAVKPPVSNLAMAPQYGWNWDPTYKLWKKKVSKFKATSTSYTAKPGAVFDPASGTYIKNKPSFGLYPTPSMVKKAQKASFPPPGQPTLTMYPGHGKQMFKWYKQPKTWTPPAGGGFWEWDDSYQLWKKPMPETDAFWKKTGPEPGYVKDPNSGYWIKQKDLWGYDPPSWLMNAPMGAIAPPTSKGVVPAAPATQPSHGQTKHPAFTPVTPPTPTHMPGTVSPNIAVDPHHVIEPPKILPPGTGAPVQPAPVPQLPPLKNRVVNFPSSFGELKFVKDLGGSTKAQLFVDNAGAKWVVKGGKDNDHIMNEYVANKAYKAAGIANVPEVTMIIRQEAGGARKYMVAEWREGVELGTLSQGSPEWKKAIKQLKDGFVTDALLGNWDVVGANYDNVLVDAHGNTWRIDNGGSLRYRAQGTLKSSTQFQADVVELQTLLDPGKNSQTSKVFSGLSEHEIRDQIKELLKRKDELIRIIQTAGNTTLTQTVKGRLDFLEAYANPAALPQAGAYTDTTSYQYKTAVDNWVKSLPAPAKNGIYEWSGSWYSYVQQVQMGKVPNASATDVNKIKSMERECDKAPKFRGRLYRGLRDMSDTDTAPFVTEGGTFKWRAFQSQSLSPDIAKNFGSTSSAPTTNRNNVLVVVDDGLGVDIRNISHHHESEFLGMQGWEYHVDKVVCKRKRDAYNGNVFIVYCHQVNHPPH